MRRAAFHSPPLLELQDQVADLIVGLCRLLTEDPALDVRVQLAEHVEPDGSVSYRFWVAVPDQWRGFLIGTRGSTADALRSFVRSYTTSKHCNDSVDVRVQQASAAS